MGPNARFVGYRGGDDLADHYAAADLFAFASLTETFGNVVLEALAAGLPVVAVRAGGVGEIVRPGETGSSSSPPTPFADGERPPRPGRLPRPPPRDGRGRPGLRPDPDPGPPSWAGSASGISPSPRRARPSRSRECCCLCQTRPKLLSSTLYEPARLVSHESRWSPLSHGFLGHPGRPPDVRKPLACLDRLRKAGRNKVYGTYKVELSSTSVLSPPLRGGRQSRKQGVPKCPGEF